MYLQKKKLFNLDNIFYFKFFFESPPQKKQFKKDVKEIAETLISNTSTKKKEKEITLNKQDIYRSHFTPACACMCSFTGGLQ